MDEASKRRGKTKGGRQVMDTLYKLIPACKIYISGQITGLELAEAERIFSEAETLLTDAGHTVINPMKILPYSPELTWKDYMKADIKVLVDCDAIYMLSNWPNSKGAKLEYDIAQGLGMTTLYQII